MLQPSDNPQARHSRTRCAPDPGPGLEKEAPKATRTGTILGVALLMLAAPLATAYNQWPGDDTNTLETFPGPYSTAPGGTSYKFDESAFAIDASNIYFDAYVAGDTDATFLVPGYNKATGGRLLGPATAFPMALLGYWWDCNGDGYVGDASTGMYLYAPSSGNACESARTLDSILFGPQVHELIAIGDLGGHDGVCDGCDDDNDPTTPHPEEGGILPCSGGANPCLNPLNEYNRVDDPVVTVNDSGSKVWGDWERPDRTLSPLRQAHDYSFSFIPRGYDEYTLPGQSTTRLDLGMWGGGNYWSANEVFVLSTKHALTDDRPLTFYAKITSEAFDSVKNPAVPPGASPAASTPAGSLVTDIYGREGCAGTGFGTGTSWVPDDVGAGPTAPSIPQPTGWECNKAVWDWTRSVFNGNTPEAEYAHVPIGTPYTFRDIDCFDNYSGVSGVYFGTAGVTGDCSTNSPPPPPQCGRSTLEVQGAPSVHDANYDGSTQIQLNVGSGRTLTSEKIDAPTVTVTSHNDAEPRHEWTVQALRAGVHHVTYTATTSCPGGPPESLSVEYTQWSPGYKCTDNGAITGTARFTVLFDTMPSLGVGDPYNHGTVVHVNPVLKFVAVEMALEDVQPFAEETTEDGNALNCEVDGILTLSYTPNDPDYPSLYGMGRIRADDAWDVTRGTTGKTVCIVDTGLRTTHEDIAGPRWLGGYDVAHNDFDVTDFHGHGTHVTGTAAATIDNNKGVAGVSQSGIKEAKVFADSGGGWASWLATGIQWCADNGGDIISMSVGVSDGAGNPVDVPAIRAAVTYAWGQGSLLVGAAGNNFGGPVTYPAAYPEVIAVTCTNSADAICSFSNQGPEAELAAPGQGIRSTYHRSNSDYETLSGTSMSTPHVAGAAALVWSHVPGLTNAQVRQYLVCTARDAGFSGWDSQYGNGIVDVRAALDAAIAGTCDPCDGTITVTGAQDGSGTYQGGVTVTVTHTSAGHPGTPTVTTSDGVTMSVSSNGHDSWRVVGPDSKTRDVTFTVTLSCGKTLTKTWRQFN